MNNDTKQPLANDCTPSSEELPSASPQSAPSATATDLSQRRRSRSKQNAAKPKRPAVGTPATGSARTAKAGTRVSKRPKGPPMKEKSLPADLPHTAEPSAEIKRLVEEQKERDERIQQRLSMIKEQAKLAIESSANRDSPAAEENKGIAEKLAKCENEISAFKSTMDSILHVTKETHCEVQRARDIVTSIQGDTSRLGLSFQQSKFIEESDEEMFRSALCSPGVRLYEVTTGQHSQQQSMGITANDEDGSSTPSAIMHGRVLRSDRGRYHGRGGGERRS